MAPTAAGKIITFYSFKGGTGRSMALANVAWILASQGKRVLAVDWDLDSPGLGRFYHPFLSPSTMASSSGCGATTSKRCSAKKESPSIFQQLPRWPAANYDPDHSGRLTPLKSLPEYDAMLVKEQKLPTVSSRPTNDIVKTVGE